ncbi:MAG: hypothetical protein ABI859_10415 [Pseudomonadota bacterium]
MQQPRINRLDDEFAAYQLRITCRQCRHVRLTNPHPIAQLLGWHTTLADAALRLRCSRCQAKDTELVAVPKPKSRR